MMVSILNQAAIDALCTATYLEHYLDCVDDLPSDLQRLVSMLRELDCLTNEVVADVKRHYDCWHSGDLTPDSMNSCADRKRAAVSQLQRSLARMQEVGDQKLALVAEIIEQIESKTRQLDQNVENLANVGLPKEEDISSVIPVASQSRQAVQTTQTTNIVNTIEATSNVASPAVSKVVKAEERVEIASSVKTGKRIKRHRTLQDNAMLEKEEKKVEEEDKVSLRKKKVKREKTDNQSPISSKLHIDPNEPTYCSCQQVSYGEMIGCDNDACPIEWFHFGCVNLTHKPKGKWYCPQCRGARPNVINPSLLTEQQKRADKVASLK